VSDTQGLLLPGWFCPAPCGVFNGTEKGPKPCRACDAPPPAPDPHGCAGLGRADLLRLIAGLAAECKTLTETTTRVQERCTELLEENRALRRALPAGEVETTGTNTTNVPLLKEITYVDGSPVEFSCSRCGVRDYVGYLVEGRLVCPGCRLEGEGR
jgi:hypothetical protein